jgi:rSAM/selenodomain-associated transferase 2
MSPTLSIVIPALDEEQHIGATLQALAPARARGAEVLVVDGGSSDGTVALAAACADRVLRAPRGRSSQLNAGARTARGDLLLFLHADSIVPAAFDRTLADVVADHPLAWGRFDVRISGGDALLAMVAAMMNVRSRLTGIATGDQALFATRALFDRAGGFPSQPLMEDIAFCRRAKRIAAPLCLRERVTTSGRRWTQQGIVRTVVLMWRLRLAYFFGADPARLAARYRDVR